MTRKGLGVASALIVLAMLAVAVVVGSGLPDEMRLPTHWNAAGEADGFSDKWSALLFPAGLTAAVSLLFYFLPSLEPRRQGLERSQGLYLWGWASLLLMGVAVQISVVSTALEWGLRTNQVILGAVGVMLIMIGNQLGKSRSMYMVGIRTPWTLASEEVWIKTHRLGGKLMVAAGLVTIVAALLPIPPDLLMTIMIAAITIAALVPAAYSYLLWRKEKADQPSENRSTDE